MEPLLPQAGRERLADLSVEIFRKSGELRTSLPSPVVRAEIGRLVSRMNSYYSNLIEGHKTLPRDIERAMNADFSDHEEDRRNQLLSVAHIRAENAMRDRLRADRDTDVFSSDFICELHRDFYSYLPEEEWFTQSRDGKRLPLKPGEIRDYNVDVGRHTPPDHAALPLFLKRFQTFYSSVRMSSMDQLIAVAAAHHRLAWIHPFGDGNGRVARLQSQAATIQAGLDEDSLWTLSRGLARRRSQYFEMLQSADQPRSGDFDGRGNLSDRALSGFCEFFLQIVRDQIQFMTELISPFSLQDRIRSYFHIIRIDLEPKLREHLSILLGHLCLAGEVRRGEVPAILGLKGTAGREVIRKALDEELISSPSAKGALRIAFPTKVIETYFPGLFSDMQEAS